MHELSIAEQLIDSVIASAVANGAEKITEVALEVGEMTLIVNSALEMAFEAVSKDTMAQGAKLIITEKSIKVKCLSCNNTFPAEIGNYLCPACNRAEGKVVEGNDILITSITCESKEDGE